MKPPIVLGAAILAGWCMSSGAASADDGQGGRGGGQSSGGRTAGPRAAAPAGPRSTDAVRSGSATPRPAPAPAHERGGHPRPETAGSRTGSASDLFLAGPFTYAPRFTTRLYFPYPRYGFSLPVYAYGSSAPSWYGSSYGGSAVCSTIGECSPFGAVYSAMPRAEEPPAAPRGNVRIDVQPIWAELYVDGTFAGTAEDFLHSLAGLNLAAGPHRFEFRAPGYETLAADITVEANRTITYRAALRRQQR